MLHPGECGRWCTVHFCEGNLLTSQRNGAAPLRSPRYEMEQGLPTGGPCPIAPRFSSPSSRGLLTGLFAIDGSRCTRPLVPARLGGASRIAVM